jgi:hypothetical protein
MNVNELGSKVFVCLVKRVTVPKGRNLDDAICREREGALRKEGKGRKGRKKELRPGGCALIRIQPELVLIRLFPRVHPA